MSSLLCTIASLCLKQTPFVLKPKSDIPTPQIPHLTLGEDIVADKRLTIIGDVHGCYDELVELLEKTRSLGNDSLILFVGDLINKGPKNKLVLEYVKELYNAFAVRGNHDEAVLREMMYSKKEEYVLSEKYQWTSELDQSDWDYLSHLPYTISIPSKKIMIVHGGLVPGKPLTRQKATDMVTIRNLVFTDYFGGDGWKGCNSIKIGYPWASLWPGPYHVYFGHDARRKLQQYDYATGLDTGCVYGGCLTAAVIDLDGSTEFYKVNAHSVYRKP